MSKPKAPKVEVRPGQVWADNDPRSAGRQLTVQRVDVTHAHCTVASVANPGVRPMIGTRVCIALHRFRPTSNGYRLVQDVEAP